MKQERFILTDTFNRLEISRHKTVLAAVRAERAHLRAVRRANGRDSYLTYSITSTHKRDLEDEILWARQELDNER